MRSLAYSLRLIGFLMPVLVVQPDFCLAQSGQPFRVAFNTWLGYSSFYIAQELGIFRRHGVSVDASVVDSLDQKNVALLRGSIDAMGGTIDSSVISASAGVAGKIVFMFDRSNGTDGILTTADVKTVSDLKGKTIALEEGFSGHFFLLYMLDKVGLSAKDVSIIPMTTDQAGAAFAAGKVDVAVTWEPYLTTALARKGSKVLVSSKELEPILADTLFVSNRTIRNRKQDVQAVVTSLLEANEYWITHRIQGDEITARYWKLPITEVTKTLATVELYGAKQQAAEFGIGQASELKRYLDKCAALWLSTGVIKNPIEADRLVDPEFMLEIKR